MDKITCIIVDDEPLASEVIRKYITDTPSLHLLHICYDAFEAMEFLRNNQTDLMFLDINMPKLSGIQMLKSFPNPPRVIFTTAYPEYAVEGFEVDALDYLLKPFDYERFLRAVNKIYTQTSEKKPAGEYLWMKSDKKLHKIDPSDIIYVEAIGDYLKIITEKTSLLVHERMSQMEEILAPYNFCRVHRSFIISIERIEFIEGNRLRIKGTDIPLGPSFRDNLLKRLGRD